MGWKPVGNNLRSGGPSAVGGGMIGYARNTTDGKATMAQSGCVSSQSCENQMHKAALFYGDLSFYFRSQIVYTTCLHIARFHSMQNKTLRTADAALEFELEMMLGCDMWKSVLLTITQLRIVKYYDRCGIATV